jgi:ribA/ribD-fused uncharacterized protein
MTSQNRKRVGDRTTEVRTYRREEAVVFFRTKEAFGGLSNMASGYPLRVGGVDIHSSEALYQACRFSHLPEVQAEILRQSNAMNAKAVSKDWRHETRPDWVRIRVNVMRWCLRIKAVQHEDTFLGLLMSTGARPIVELSRRDDFWGALERPAGVLTGRNVLGRLLMEVRRDRMDGSLCMSEVPPPHIKGLQLLGEPIPLVPSNAQSLGISPSRLC